MTKPILKEMFKNYRARKLAKFYSELDKSGDILLSCTSAGIDYYILTNWMRFDKELRDKVRAQCKSSCDEASILLAKRFQRKNNYKTPEIIALILEAIQHGIGIVQACERIAGVNYFAFHRWCQEDPEL